MSAIERSMMMVETGSSIGSVANPNAPPNAPDATARLLCRSREPAPGASFMVSTATLSAASRPLWVAAEMICVAPGGSAMASRSSGLPTMPASRAGKPGCSSASTAARSAFRSSADSGTVTPVGTSARRR